MNRTERFYKIDQMLDERRLVPIGVFLEELDVSRATFKRDVEYLRDRLHAPIVWDREAGGYRFENIRADGPACELPGLWFSAGELYALLAAHKLLGDLAPGILAAQVAPLQARLAALLEASGHSAAEITQRVRLLSMAKRAVEPRFFTDIIIALLERRRITIEAWNRGRDETNRRTISPQRLVHYRDNWYLDAWCHWRDALRSFSLDAIQAVEVLTAAAIDVEDGELDEQLGAGYGIFAGDQVQWARLRFSAERVRWVAHERWHPNQRGCHDAEGRWQLDLPYADPRELVMDILRHVPDVEVMWPPELVRTVCDRLREGLAVMQQGLDE